MRSNRPGFCRAIPLLLVMIAGCQPPAEEVVDTGVGSGRSVSEGKVDETLLGSWLMKELGNESKMTLEKDGAYVIVSKIQSQGGLQNSKVDGKWSSKDKELLMERNGPDGKPFTVVYEWKLAGKVLELATKGSRVKYKYTRQ